MWYKALTNQECFINVCSLHKHPCTYKIFPKNVKPKDPLPVHICRGWKFVLLFLIWCQTSTKLALVMTHAYATSFPSLCEHFQNWRHQSSLFVLEYPWVTDDMKYHSLTWK
jgi:hypothetical protein